METSGFGLNLYFTPKEKHQGLLLSVGLDFYPGRKFEIKRTSNQEQVHLSGSNAYALVGYRYWRLYSAVGLQYPFSIFNNRDTDLFDLSSAPGARVIIGGSILSWLKLEAFFGFHRSIVKVNEGFITSNEPTEYDLSYQAQGVYVRVVLNELLKKIW